MTIPASPVTASSRAARFAATGSEPVRRAIRWNVRQNRVHHLQPASPSSCAVIARADLPGPRWVRATRTDNPHRRPAASRAEPRSSCLTRPRLKKAAHRVWAGKVGGDLLRDCLLSLRQSEREHLLELVRDPAGDRSAGRSHTLGIVVTTHREDQLQRQRLVETQTILCSFDVFLGIWQVNGAQRLVQTDESVLGPSLGGQRLLDRIELVEHLPHAPHDGPALDLAGRRVQRDQCAVEDGQIEFGAGILICASQARKVTGSLMDASGTTESSSPTRGSGRIR